MDREATLKAINAHVDEYVEKNNIKKECVAEMIGMGRTTFYTKLRGQSDFSVFEALEMANLFGLAIDDLLVEPKDNP